MTTTTPATSLARPACLDVTTGNELHKLTASDAVASEDFGGSVAVSGNMAIVGAHGREEVATDSGAAYLFDVTTGQELYKLTPIDAAYKDNFGISVAIDGDIAVVGARENTPTRPGSAYIFDVTTGSQLLKLAPPDPASTRHFGHSVAVSGDKAVVAAGASAYIYDVTTGDLLHELTPSDPEVDWSFGDSVAIDGDVAIVGAWARRHSYRRSLPI